MLKFMVVLYKKAELSEQEFRSYLRTVHGEMAQRLPGLKKYVQNYAVDDPTRKPPGWHGVVELYFEDWEAMERAWRSPEGVRATEDLAAFADSTRTSWSVVEELKILG